MSNAPIPTQNGDTPTKVILLGLAGDNSKALTLYNRIAGEVAAFLGKARQNRMISGQPSSYMQQARPGGGSFRYQYNNRQETVYVTLTPPEESFARSLDARNPVSVPPPRLAVDVVFEPSLYLSGDVYSKTVTTTIKREWVWVNGDPIPVDESELQPRTGQYWTGDDWYDPIGPRYQRAHEVLQSITIVSGENRDPATQYDIDILNSVAPSRELGIFIYRVSYVHWLENSQAFESFYWMMSTGSFWMPSFGYEPTWTGRLGDPYEVAANQHVRDQVSYYDTINVVRAHVDTPTGSYEADSTGAGGDVRLKSLAQAGADVTITRTVGAASPPPGFWGAGFLAQPMRTIDLSETSVQPTVIDIYIAAMNTVKANTFPGPEGATFAADDPSFTYDTKRDLNFRVTAREFIDGTGGFVVRVDPAVSKREKHFTAEAVDAEPTVEGENVDTDSGRDDSWKFAADKGWVDGGQAPADPAAQHMGELLDDSGATTKTVLAYNPAPRTVNTAPSWSGPVTAMTKVASIEWTPPSRPHEHGKAKITLL